MARWDVHARSARAGALLAAVILCAAAAPAGAEVRVTEAGGGGQLAIEAHDATVQQVLDALGETGAIHVQTSEALSRPVTGTYAGTLRQVLSRILDGYDHVIRFTSSGIQVDVVGGAKSGKVTAAGGPTMTAARVGPRVAPGVGPRISSNVDADEEASQSKPAPVGPQTVNLASGPRVSAPPAIQPTPAGPIGHAMHPRVSSNVDADEAQ